MDRHRIISFALLMLVSLLPSGLANESSAQEPPTLVKPPNILFCVADDWGMHAGAYGCRWIRTPTIDALAKEGLVFDRAYTPTAKCSTSRACMLTGRHPWLLKAGANHYCNFPAEFKTWMEALKDEAWTTGFTGKGWGPGDAFDALGKSREMTGKSWSKKTRQVPTKKMSAIDYAANFKDFLDDAPSGKSWAFWFGCNEPHRDYEKDSGVSKGGFKLNEIDAVPKYWPDNAVTRGDMLDYAFEVQYFDAQIQIMVDELKRRGCFDNTLIVITSDNGMPFPRIKGNVYEAANHLPLIFCWKGHIFKPGRHVPDLVSFVDFAPTVFEAASLPWAKSGLAPCNGRSLLEFCRADARVPERNSVFLGKERTDSGRPGDVGYPTRAIVKGDWLLMRNYEPSRWPAGNPETGFRDADPSPTKSLILQSPDTSYWSLCFGMRPAIEFYNLKDDPECLHNLSGRPEHQAAAGSLLEELESELRREGDPRALGQGAIFDTYPYINPANQGLYEKWLSQQKDAAR